MCRCQKGFAGVACDIPIEAKYPHVELLVDDRRLPKSIPVPLRRAGHTMVSCGNNRLYVFGGYHLERGLLNDMWHYETSSGNWTLLFNSATAQPQGR